MPQKNSNGQSGYKSLKIKSLSQTIYFKKWGIDSPTVWKKCGTIPLILLLPATPAPASIPNYGVQISPESAANTDCRYFLHGYDVKAGSIPPIFSELHFFSDHPVSFAKRNPRSDSVIYFFNRKEITVFFILKNQRIQFDFFQHHLCHKQTIGQFFKCRQIYLLTQLHIPENTRKSGSHKA